LMYLDFNRMIYWNISISNSPSDTSSYYNSITLDSSRVT
jgi:hypothetical protein